MYSQRREAEGTVSVISNKYSTTGGDGRVVISDVQPEKVMSAADECKIKAFMRKKIISIQFKN